MMSYVDELKTALILLASRGFQIVEELAAPEHFGNARVVAASPRILVRLTADRGQIFADVANATRPEEWFELRSVLGVITSCTGGKWGPWQSPNEATNELGAHLQEVEEVLRDLEKTKGLQRAP